MLYLKNRDTNCCSKRCCWFGFIDDIDSNRDKGIIVCDDFPTNIEICDPSKESPSEDED